MGHLVVPYRYNKRLILLPLVVTGISYETLNIMHRAVARVNFILIMLHSFTKVPYVDQLLRRVRTLPFVKIVSLPQSCFRSTT